MKKKEFDRRVLKKKAKNSSSGWRSASVAVR